MILGSEHEPAEGSELAEDDLTWPPARISSLASLGLGTAQEHLQAIRVSVEAHELFPSAQATLGRTALIGAALAVWMLQPDEREERLRRSLSLARYDYTEHLKFGNQARAGMHPDDLHPEADVQMRRVIERRSEVETLLQGVGRRTEDSK